MPAIQGPSYQGLGKQALSFSVLLQNGFPYTWYAAVPLVKIHMLDIQPIFLWLKLFENNLAVSRIVT